mmetsp:Transcript_57571/g.123782  ORF Transcript_57571/g.123782 Transcript_57571/m.123782 type:complete len:343 (-) Transcript_57571:1278-2306(-)
MSQLWPAVWSRRVAHCAAACLPASAPGAAAFAAGAAAVADFGAGAAAAGDCGAGAAAAADFGAGAAAAADFEAGAAAAVAASATGPSLPMFPATVAAAPVAFALGAAFALAFGLASPVVWSSGRRLRQQPQPLFSFAPACAPPAWPFVSPQACGFPSPAGAVDLHWPCPASRSAAVPVSAGNITPATAPVTAIGANSERASSEGAACPPSVMACCCSEATMAAEGNSLKNVHRAFSSPGCRTRVSVPEFSKSAARESEDERRWRFSSIATRAPVENQWFPRRFRLAPLSMATRNPPELAWAIESSWANWKESTFRRICNTFTRLGHVLARSAAASTNTLWFT